MHTAGIPAPPPRALGLAALAAACLTLLALAWLALAPTRQLPAPAAPPSPDRMMEHVATLAAAPRPIATDANARARDYIADQLRGMGLAPLVQTATVQKSTLRPGGGTHMTLGVVHNILARLPGSAPDAMRRPALLLAAHYDTGKTTPGAARSGAQVAALLETARALRAGPAQLNDIVLLFADGEDVGGLGAKGFAEQHPWARQVGLTLKFDSAGSSGPPVLYDASGAGGMVLRGLAGAAPDIAGSSLMARLRKLLPDTPRIGPLAAIDAPALLFVNSGRRFGGERTLDSIDRLDPAMPAQLGETMLHLARHYGDAPLVRGKRGAHSVFMLPLVGAVQHPAILSWGLGALGILLLARGYRDALARLDTSVAPLVQGFFGVAVLLLAARMFLWERRDALAAMTQAPTAEPALVLLVSGACLFIGSLYLLGRLVGGVPVFLGAMAWLAVALVSALLAAPETAYVLAWPLAAALGAFTVLGAPAATMGLPARAALVAAALAAALLLFVPALRDAWTGLAAPHGVYVPALLIALMLLCFASLLLLLPVGRIVAAVLGLVFAACLALPVPGPVPDAAAGPVPRERPAQEPNRLVYFKDMNSWRAYWLLPPQALDAWTRQLFPNLDRPAIQVDVFGWHSPRRWYAVAPREDRIAFPEAFVLRSPALAFSTEQQRTTPVMRQVEFTLRSKNRAPHIELRAAGTRPWRSTLDGRLLTSGESAWSVSLYGMGERLLRFTLDAPADDVLAVVVEERMPGLPEHLLPPGAPPFMPGTGMTISSDVLRFY
ncbi:M28 family peptidase [Massilia consociata]|uniref:M28 family peptidase n=1 Tax=Massilia consociata TaxID=760117 RepID=A0ABV6FL03_9BURK